MKSNILFTITLTVILFIAGCNSAQNDETAASPTYPNDAPVNETEDEYFARENLDLQAVGDIFRESESAEDFESRLNSDNSVNNLDLNGDGYADYISINEYEDRDTGYRGFTLLDNFGNDSIQEIATIILDRTLNNGRDSRLYIDGNDQIYGNDYVYRADWKDKTLDIVNWAFGNRKSYYQSPYYYGNYPDNYTSYQTIKTPVYKTRIRDNYAAPVFTKTDYNEIQNIKIKSKYKDKYYDKIYAKLANPNDAQKEFRKNYPKRPDFAPNIRSKGNNVPKGLEKQIKEVRKDDKKAEKEFRKNKDSFSDKSFKNEKRDNDRKEMKRGKPDKQQKDFKIENKGRENDGGNGKMKGGGGGKNKGKGGKGKH